MNNFLDAYFPWVMLAVIVILVVVAGTVYSFNRRRYIDYGPRKGEAAKPQTVRRENPPDRGR